jgi:serine/threonine-protein kinase
MVIDAMDDGHRVSHYRILRQIGRGGMGVVYQAEDLRLGRAVALKFLSTDLLQDEHARERFKTEARAVAALDHASICGIHDIEETPERQLFICMPYYEGETLTDRLQRARLPARDALEIVSRVADGLSFAHAHGITHRDVKPSNVMLTAGGVKILDFGLAKLRGTTSLTMSGHTVGTCAYMSPEQAQGQRDVDGRSDVFSLGVVLYECLTGRKPFDGDNAAAVVYQIVNEDAPPLERFVPHIRDELQHIVDRALQKDPARRYPSAEDFRSDVDRFAAGLKIDTQRHRLRLTAVALGVAAVATLAVVPASRHAFEREARRWFATGDTQVAILPFENVGRDPMNQAFCDGLMETLASQLGRLQTHRASLSVVPPIAVREREVTTPVAARKVLGVHSVFTGSVQRLGDQLRVTLSLIDVAHGGVPKQTRSAIIDTPTWREQDLQDEAVARMAEMLDIRLEPEEKTTVAAGRTSVSSAYGFYVQGVGHLSHYEVGEDLERAIEAFSTAVFHDSLYALAYAGLGEAYWRKYRDSQDPRWIDPALRNAERARSLDDALARAHVVLGMIKAGTGGGIDAVPEFERAIALEPANADAYSGLAAAYTDLDRPEDAEATFRRAIAVRPDYWGGYHELGKFYYRRGEYARAIEQWDEVARLTPHNKYAFNNLGAAHMQLAQWDAAREMFRRSLDAEPNYRAFSNLGALDYMQGNYVESARMCEKAVEMNDRSYMSWVNLGNAYYWSPGKRPEAMKAYESATGLAEAQRKLTPDDPSLIASLAGYYAILGRKELSQSLIGRALSLAPTNKTVLYFVGHAQEQLGERDRAIESIGLALANGYSSADVAQDPFMHELRRDPRYGDMMARAETKK